MFTLVETLTELSSSPAWLALILLIGTYILEDAAIISGALMAADGLLPPEYAVVALALGILTGDLGLYGIGYAGRRWPLIAKQIGRRRVVRLNTWLEKNRVFAVLAVRLIPGLRLPCYLACGLFAMSLPIFFLTVLVASAIWTTVIFLLVYLLGLGFWSELSEWKWLFLFFVISVFVLLRRSYCAHVSKRLEVDS